MTGTAMGTWLTRTLGIEVPLIQAPMAGVSEGPMPPRSPLPERSA